MNRRGLPLACGLLVAVVCSWNVSPAQAADNLFQVSNGAWNVATNWSNGFVPDTTNNQWVRIFNNQTCNYDSTMGVMSFGVTGTPFIVSGTLGGSTLNISGGTLRHTGQTIFGWAQTGTGNTVGYLNVTGTGTFDNLLTTATNGTLTVGYHQDATKTADGYVNVSDSGTIICAEFRCGNSAGAFAHVTISDDAQINCTAFNLGQYDSQASVIQTGGTVTDTGYFAARGTGTTKTYTISGGLLDVRGDMSLAETASKACVFTQDGGTVLSNTFLSLGRSAVASGVYALNGGTLQAKNIQGQYSGGTLKLNGGTLKAGAGDKEWNASYNFLDASWVLNVLVGSGGAIVDSNGFNITIGQSLQQDGASTGGLTKRGEGTVTLTTNNTYIGATEVKSGTLALSGSGSIANSASVAIEALATLDVTGLGFFAMSGSQPFTFDIDGAGDGSAGLLNAANLDISAGNVAFNTVGTLDDAAYVFATYSGTLTGTQFASTGTLPTGYSLNYAYNGNQIALVLIPEPGTLALTAIGLLGLLAYAWRKRSK